MYRVGDALFFRHGFYWFGLERLGELEGKWQWCQHLPGRHRAVRTQLKAASVRQPIWEMPMRMGLVSGNCPVTGGIECDAQPESSVQQTRMTFTCTRSRWPGALSRHSPCGPCGRPLPSSGAGGVVGAHGLPGIIAVAIQLLAQRFELPHGCWCMRPTGLPARPHMPPGRAGCAS